MAKRTSQSIVDPTAQSKIDQFRQELDEKIDQAIDHHEFKMVYIGIATLILFVGVIYAAWKF
ncbi:MAG: hypothetical protein MUF72_18135 [Elainella sp. Prado103]|jgi:hypothetical protein|nr:hypothetical protein [Elainella sp. Prado103]